MKWIKASERLPDFDGLCYVFCESADPERPLFATAWWSPTNQRWECISDHWRRGITHWMKPESPTDRDTTIVLSEGGAK